MANQYPQPPSRPPTSSRGLGLPRWVVALFVIVFVLFPFFRPMRDRVMGPEGKVLVGQAAPDFSFLDSEGAPHRLTEFRGNVVLVNFWASWCDPCMQEMPDLQALEKKMGEKKFKLLAVNVDETVEQTKGKLPLAQMPEGLFFNAKDSELAPYKVKTIPVSFLIDSEGIVRKAVAGTEDWGGAKSVNEISQLLQ